MKECTCKTVPSIVRSVTKPYYAVVEICIADDDIRNGTSSPIQFSSVVWRTMRSSHRHVLLSSFFFSTRKHTGPVCVCGVTELWKHNNSSQRYSRTVDYFVDRTK